MLRMAEGVPVPSNQRPLRMIVSYGVSVPRRLDRQSRRGAASLLDHTPEYKWMVEHSPFLSGEAADLDHT
jgi:hypothetical protein